MIENLIFLAPPITASVILAGLLSFFGNHILSRGIIFIDIAIAQIAALGTMIGLLLGLAEQSALVQVLSYIFTLGIISLFALTKFRDQRIPQEAIIGIIYCVGLGLASLFAEKIPGGSNFITKTITGNILWVTWKQMWPLVFLLLVVVLIHSFFGKHFIKISSEPNGYPFSPKRLRMYELLFYVSFGLVIVKSVQIGGIFLVFILLIAPSTAATLFTNTWKTRFIWSWIIGIIGSVIGMYLSYSLNISNGPAIVCLLGIIVFILAFIVLARRHQEKLNQNSLT